MWLCSMHPRRQASNTSTIAGSLRKHLKTHTGEKPNKWNQCVYAICILRARQFEEIFVNAKWEKSNKCNQCDFVPSWADVLRTNFKIHSEKSQTNATNMTMPHLMQVISGNIWKQSGEKPNKCKLCIYASSLLRDLRTHLKNSQDVWAILWITYNIRGKWKIKKKRKQLNMFNLGKGPKGPPQLRQFSFFSFFNLSL